jgi:hypothetical protein
MRQLASSCLFVLSSAWKNLASTWRIFLKFDMWVFLENLSRKTKFHQFLTWKTGTLREDLCTFMIISRSFLFIMRNVSDRNCRETQNREFILNYVFRKSSRLWDNMENRLDLYSPQMRIWRMRIACWLTNATTHTHTHARSLSLSLSLSLSQYDVTLIAFPLQQWLHQKSSRYVTRSLPLLIVKMLHLHLLNSDTVTFPIMPNIIIWCFSDRASWYKLV